MSSSFRCSGNKESGDAVVFGHTPINIVIFIVGAPTLISGTIFSGPTVRNSDSEGNSRAARERESVVDVFHSQHGRHAPTFRRLDPALSLTVTICRTTGKWRTKAVFRDIVNSLQQNAPMAFHTVG